MKILLVGINSKFIHTNIALRYLRKFTEDLDYECSIREYTINQGIRHILEGIIAERPQLVGFSTYIWNIEYVERISVMIKRIDKNIKIFYGGPEVSYDSAGHLGSLVGDFILRGEGEATYREFVEALIDIEKTGRDIMEDGIPLGFDIPGLTYRMGTEILKGKDRKKMDLEDLPFPYENGEELEDKVAYTEGSRGCPYFCKYCLSASEKDLRFVRYDRIIENIGRLMGMDTKLIKFIDRTFNIHPDAGRIWAYIIGLDTDVTFHFEISPNLIRREHLDILRQAPPGRIQFEIGIQSTDEVVLDHIDRLIGFQEVKDILKDILSLKNIHQHLDLIAGLPMDTMDTFRKSFNEVFALRPDMLQLGFLKIIKGTPMAREAGRYGMVYSPYSPYEILRTDTMDFDDLTRLKQAEHVLDKYHNSGKFRNTMEYVLKGHESPLDFFLALGEHFHVKGFEERSPGSTEYYWILRDFSLMDMKARGKTPHESLLNEIVKYDYLVFNKKQYLPDFLHRNYKDTKEIKDRLKKEGDKKGHVEWFSIDVVAYFESETIRERMTPILFEEGMKPVSLPDFMD